MLKGLSFDVLTCDQGTVMDYVVVNGVVAPCCFGLTTGQYGETQFLGGSNIVQEFSGQPYLMLTVITNEGVEQFRRIPLQPWSPV